MKSVIKAIILSLILFTSISLPAYASESNIDDMQQPEESKDSIIPKEATVNTWHREYRESSCPKREDYRKVRFYDGRLEYGCNRINGTHIVTKFDNYSDAKYQAMTWTGGICGNPNSGRVYFGSIRNNYAISSATGNHHGGCQDHGVKWY